jgi:hypothetical protein
VRKQSRFVKTKASRERPAAAVSFMSGLVSRDEADLVGLPTSQLATLPGATHRSIVGERAGRLLAVIAPFLAAPRPGAA